MSGVVLGKGVRDNEAASPVFATTRRVDIQRSVINDKMRRKREKISREKISREKIFVGLLDIVVFVLHLLN